jgi:two-component system chemotaxis response regulator CheB
VVIGASTGGPQALGEILRSLPDNVTTPIFVAQHLPPAFVLEFIASVAPALRMKIEIGTQNGAVSDGTIYVAPGDNDMKIMHDGAGIRHLIMVPASGMLKPSIDILMASAATEYGAGCLGIILTGMGVDGLEGMRAIKSVGGKTIVQDEATSAVYGMAQAVNKEHLADNVLPLPDIGGAIVEWSTPHG